MRKNLLFTGSKIQQLSVGLMWGHIVVGCLIMARSLDTPNTVCYVITMYTPISTVRALKSEESVQMDNRFRPLLYRSRSCGFRCCATRWQFFRVHRASFNERLMVERDTSSSNSSRRKVTISLRSVVGCSVSLSSKASRLYGVTFLQRPTRFGGDFVDSKSRYLALALRTVRGSHGMAWAICLVGSSRWIMAFIVSWSASDSRGAILGQQQVRAYSGRYGSDGG